MTIILNILKVKQTLLLNFLLILFLSSCATLFIPKKQKVTIKTGNADATVYIDNEEVGKGDSIRVKVKKGQGRQVVVRTPGAKDSYYTLVPDKRLPIYYVSQVLNLGSGLIGLIVDMGNPKSVFFTKYNEFKSGEKFVYKKPTNKYIEVSKITWDASRENNIKYYFVYRTKDLEKRMNEAVLQGEKNEAKQKEKSSKKKTLVDDKKASLPVDTKFTVNIFKTLRKTGFIDTVNNIFTDNNNTIILEAKIRKVHIYDIRGKQHLGGYIKSNVFLTWYFKNAYDEILDSLETNQFSGEFSGTYSNGFYSRSNDYDKILGDAVDISYVKLHQNPKFTKYINLETEFKNNDPLLVLQGPKSFVTDEMDAGLASVIVKTKNGHGSGFAITQDGYIITNYHVISKYMTKKDGSLTVVTSTGLELPGEVVRYNKYRDLALVKVNQKFDKVFKVSNTKNFKSLQSVYTIGAPKSLELGQSMSNGMISNERKVNNNILLQLSMSVNAGNSGGPVFDEKGELHGVIVSKLVGENTEGISFAVPAYLLQEFLNIQFK